MSGFTDFVDLGFFPLQDHAHGQDGTPASARQMIAAGRISRMTDPADTSDPGETMIQYAKQDGLGTLGDVHPWMFWQTRERAKRGMGSWSQVFGALAVDADGYYAKIGAQPFRDYRFVNDTRYRELDPAWPAGISHVPRGAMLAIVPGTDEADQNELALWADPRLIAPNTSGPGECGTLVVDMQPTHEICMSGAERPGIGGRHARLQSIFRVVAVEPSQTFGDLPGGRAGNIVALNFSVSGVDRIPNYGAFFGLIEGNTGGGPTTGGPSSQGPTTGGPSAPSGPITGVPSGGAGAVAHAAKSASELKSSGRALRGESDTGSGGFGGAAAVSNEDDEEFAPRTFGKFEKKKTAGHGIGLMANLGAGGPIHPGAGQDKHRHGTDRDGHPINAAHISTNAFFYADKDRDAPIEFGGGYPNPQPLPIPAPAHLSYDALAFHSFNGGTAQGRWRFWCETPDVTPQITDIPTPPGIPTGGGGDPVHKNVPVLPPWPTGGPDPIHKNVPVLPPWPTGGPITGQPGGAAGGGGGNPGTGGPGNPGSKTIPGGPAGGGPITGPKGAKPEPPTGGGTPGGPLTGGGSGGTPSVPCKQPSELDEAFGRNLGRPLTGPHDKSPASTGGERRPSQTGGAPRQESAVWMNGGRGTAGSSRYSPDPERPIGGGVSPTPVHERLFGTSGELIPFSAIAGRGGAGSEHKDPRMELGRWAGQSQITRVPQEIPGVVEKIGTSEGRVALYTLFRPMAQGFAAVNFRPQMTISGYPSFEHNPQMPAPMYFADEARRPQTVAMHAFGGQLANEGEWDYVEAPESSRARGGTADGGVVFHPPRFELEDYYSIGNSGADVEATTGANATKGYVLAAPGVCFALGLPNADGTLAANSVTLSQVPAATTSYKPLLIEHNATKVFGAYDDGTDVIVELGTGGNGAVTIPNGTTAQRPATPVRGMLRLNTSGANDLVEFYDNTAGWTAVGSNPTAADIALTSDDWAGSLAGSGITNVQELANWIDANLAP